MSNYLLDDGGPAFPFYFPTEMVGDASERHPGMSLRAYFVGQELVRIGANECGVRDIPEAYDRVAEHCLRMADTLLRALAEPTPIQYRPLYVDEQARLDAANRLAVVVTDLQQDPAYTGLPETVRVRLAKALEDVTDAELPF